MYPGDGVVSGPTRAGGGVESVGNSQLSKSVRQGLFFS
jgi:hypothetical protein